MKKNSHNGKSCKQKIERMMNTRKPTGTAHVPVLILQAKEIKDKIFEKKIIDSCTSNNDNND